MIDAQKALVQSQKIEAIGKLTFGLAHDFNNLLTVIINSLDMIAIRPGADARTKELVDTAMRAADRGALLTRQLLSFARGQNLVAERHDLNELLTRSMDLYRRTCGPAIEFKVDLAPDLPSVFVSASLPSPDSFGFLGEPRKSVAYQPLPFSWKPAADTCLTSVASPQAGHCVSGASESF